MTSPPFAFSDSSVDEEPSVSLPKPPGEQPPYSFPLAATLAPAIGSGVIWAITQSAFALVFAFLGPLIALASLVDATVHSRRRRKKDLRKFDSDVVVALTAIRARHDEERERRDRAHPGIRRVMANPGSDAERWTADPREPVALVVGRGSSRSTLGIEGSRATDDLVDRTVAARLDSVCAVARKLLDAPILVDARLGVGIVGARPSARAAARAMVLQLARAADPSTTIIRADDGGEWDWLRALPHVVEPRAGNSRAEQIQFVLDDRASPPSTLLIAIADCNGDLPRECRSVITIVRGEPARLVTGGGDTAIQLEFAGIEDAIGYSVQLVGCAEREGLVLGASKLPDSVPFALLDTNDHDRRAGLKCTVGVTATGRWELDLVTDGPHAVVGGTTGSGKSELLITWILAIAVRYPPSLVTFLLVDFKGGASFATVAGLPHSVGLITDLDQRAAKRALESLRAEVLFRERTIAEAGARSIDDLTGTAMLARLVIVVDEFAALSKGFPELHELFADLAARGRSLGVHLVLCTQRPAEALRDSILANCALRVSLRLNNRADSTAVIGTAEAADLPRAPQGRALVVRAGESPVLVQVALTDTSDSTRVASLWPDHPPARRPWCEPLSSMIPHGDLTCAAGGITFARADVPAEQRQETAAWIPESQGNLLVLGAHGTGKSTALTALAAGSPPGTTRFCRRDIEGAWDDLVEISTAIATGFRPDSDQGLRLFLIDDVDSLVAAFSQDHQAEFLEMLARVLRDGPRHRVFTVLAAGRISSVLTTAAASCDSRFLLRLANRQDHLLAGGNGDQYDSKLTPGGGFWRDNLVQVGFLPALPASGVMPPATLSMSDGSSTAIVTTSPRETALSLSAPSPANSASSSRNSGRAGIRVIDLSTRQPKVDDLLIGDTSAHTVIIGTPEAWLSAWSLFGAIRVAMPVVFDGCSASEFRAVTSSRRLPPPLSASTRSVWVLASDSTITRAVLPRAAAGAYPNPDVVGR